MFQTRKHSEKAHLFKAAKNYLRHLANVDIACWTQITSEI